MCGKISYHRQKEKTNRYVVFETYKTDSILTLPKFPLYILTFVILVLTPEFVFVSWLAFQ